MKDSLSTRFHLRHRRLPSQPSLTLAPVGIDPVLFESSFNHRGLRHDQSVYEEPTELALAHLGLQAAPALGIWHNFRWRKRTLAPGRKGLCASSNESCGTSVAT